MQISTLITLATTATLLAKASPAPSQFNRRKETDVNKCRPLDKGQCTLNAIASMVVVPALDTTGFPGEADGHWVDVFDNECNSIYVSDDIKAVGSGKGFSGSIKIKGAAISAPKDNNVEFHADSIGAGFIRGVTSTYLGQETSDCDCQDDSKGLEGVTSCRCPFPC